MTVPIQIRTILLVLLAPPVLAQNDIRPAQDDISPMEQTVPVAAEEPEPVPESDGDQPGEEATEEDLFQEFARYRQLVNEGTFDEADLAAKRVVEMAIRIYGPVSSETASALNNLAIVQHGTGQYEAAIQNFTSAVEIIEVVKDRLNSDLVNPLKGLGAAQLANSRPDQANRSFGRAAHITQVNEGPHNIGQVEILESIAETFVRMGDLKQARSILDRIHILNVRFYEKDPMGLIPSLMNRAAWQHRAGYYNEERATYRRAIRIVESSGDKTSPMLIEPLRRLGESFYYVDVSMAAPQQQGMVATGEIYFKRAARIAEKADDLDWRDLVKAKLALADYYSYMESQNRARKIYKEMWDVLSTNEERVEYRDELFSQPVAIRSGPLPNVAGTAVTQPDSTENLKTGKVVVTYNVSPRGRVRNLKTEAFPGEFTDMQRMVHREIRRRVHRPRVVDGLPVDADDLVFEHQFSYTQSDLEKLRTDKAADEQSRKSDSN